MTSETPAPIERVSMGGTETGIWLRILRAVRGTAPIFLILLAMLVAIYIQFPTYNLVSIFKNGAPLAILAAGQLFVIVSGEFDLSVGSLITVVVTMSASISKGDPDKTLMVFGVMIVLGIAVGLVNGLVVTRLHVPSFVATLGMMMILLGGVNYITGGTPLGDLPANFRTLGRDGIKNFPVLGTLPYSIIVLIVAGLVMYWLLHRSNFGQRVFAVGGNARAAHLAGIDVASVKTLAFIISALSAVVAGILLGGYAGVSVQVGKGYEFQAISAAVIGGAALTGGRGSVAAAIAGGLTLQALFALLNVLGYPQELRDTVQGVIVIAAVAYGSYRLRRAS
jgi:ribose transport system permease protein